jgi:hypothetical protein
MTILTRERLPSFLTKIPPCIPIAAFNATLVLLERGATTCPRYGDERDRAREQVLP